MDLRIGALPFINGIFFLLCVCDFNFIIFLYKLRLEYILTTQNNGSTSIVKTVISVVPTVRKQMCYATKSTSTTSLHSALPDERFSPSIDLVYIV